MFKNMGMALPFYVTRPHGARGETASYSASLWMVLLFFFMIWINAVVWGVVGLITAVRVVF